MSAHPAPLHRAHPHAGVDFVSLFETFLQPGIGLMQRVGLRAKFAVICGFLLVPLGIATYGLMQYSSATIAFAEAERLGVAYTAPLNQLLHAASLARAGSLDSTTVSRAGTPRTRCTAG